MLALLRNISPAWSSVIKGDWQRDPYKGNELHEKTVGLVGFGRIGKLVAQYLNAFGCNILAYDPKVPSDGDHEYVEFVSLHDLLGQSDIVSIHVNLNSSTKYFFGAGCFDQMKNGAIFVNTSRGELIDEGALLHSLQSGKIVGAAVDVLCNEHELQKNANSPLITYSRKNDNLIITPHIGGCTQESMWKTEVFMANKLSRSLNFGVR